jgi:hypothetical protein
MVATRSQAKDLPNKEPSTEAAVSFLPPEESPSLPARGLSLHQQKKFFQALEDAGGLNASVRDVCDSNKADFGNAGTELRRQLRNRVNYFRDAVKAKD